MEIIVVILIIAVLQSVFFYFLKNSRNFLAQALISLTIITLYFTLIPKLYVSFKSLEGCALPGLGIHMAFWIIGTISTLIVSIVFLYIRSRKITKSIINKNKTSL